MQQPLNILQVGSGFPGWGGAELHVINLASQLEARGHRVTIACRPEGFVEREAKKRGLKTASLTVKRQLDFRDSNAFRQLMQQERFDVVHVHWSTDYVVAPYIARRSGVPAVLMSRHSPYPLKSALGRFLYDHFLFDRIIALSDSVRRTLTEQGLRSERVLTIHHGTDTDAFRDITKEASEIRSAWGVPQEAFLIGLAGRLAPEKGAMVLLEALAKTPQNVYGVLIGEGAQEKELRSRAQELGVTARVIFAGFRSDVNNAINALDALTLASTWAEPCAAVVQQAMALGKPVIGTNIGGTPEMISKGETGLLVPPGDADALAKAIEELACDPEKRRVFGTAGKERAEALFTLGGMTDRIEALYYELASGSSAHVSSRTIPAAAAVSSLQR